LKHEDSSFQSCGKYSWITFHIAQYMAWLLNYEWEMQADVSSCVLLHSHTDVSPQRSKPRFANLQMRRACSNWSLLTVYMSYALCLSDSYPDLGSILNKHITELDVHMNKIRYFLTLALLTFTLDSVVCNKFCSNKCIHLVDPFTT
jgi:hypothetical protein